MRLSLTRCQSVWVYSRRSRLREDETFGRVPERVHRQPTGVWLISSKDSLESTSVERHLLFLLDLLESRLTDVGAVRSEADLTADFFCYWVSATGNGGPAIPPPTLSRVPALDASLEFDFYDGS